MQVHERRSEYAHAFPLVLHQRLRKAAAVVILSDARCLNIYAQPREQDLYYFDAKAAAINSIPRVFDKFATLSLATDTPQIANRCTCVQPFSKVLVMLLMIVKFAAAGVVCIGRISSVLPGMPGSGRGSPIRP